MALVVGLIVVVALSVGSGAGATAEADGPTTIACSNTALTNAFATGGSYVFAADCNLSVLTPLTLAAGRTLSLDAGTYTVTFNGPNISQYGDSGSGDRFATIDGTLTLTGITLSAFADGGQDFNGTPGTAGKNGTAGPAGNSPSNGTGADGGPGTPGTPGGNGGNGGDGEPASGGALTISGSGDVTLDDVTLSTDLAVAGGGGAGGAGGAGGQGGNGGGGATPSGGNGSGGSGGDGGAGGKGGDGGNSGDGGEAEGGAIDNAGTLIVDDSTFSYDQAVGGSGAFYANSGGLGGNGGVGGGGENGNGSGAQGNGGQGAAAGDGGAGGAAGTGGDAYGGAIYNTGKLDVSGTTFSNDEADAGGGQAGPGGNGGNGGSGGGPGQSGASVGVGGAGGAGGAGGDGGSVGGATTAIGGAIYSTEPFTLTGGSTSGDAVAVDGSPNTPFESSVNAIGGFGGMGGSNNNGPGGRAADGADGTPLITQQGIYVSGTATDPDFYPEPNTGATVSGTVFNESCTSSGCASSGLADISVALSGTASDGSKVTQITSSAADGTWSLDVPRGMYTATVNGDGTGFTPETLPVNAASGDVSGVNFSTCTGTADGVLSAPDDRGAREGQVATSGPLCEATYTLHIDATIPQTTFLDPAGGSAYPRRLDGKDFPFDNAGTIALSYLHVNAFKKYVGSYPVCMPETLKEQSWRKHIVVHWQTTYRGAGVNLGEITVPLEWNRHTRTVSVVGKATAEEGHLVRIYKYLMAGTERTCTAKGTVEPEFDVEPTGNTFKVTASWDFPFPAKDGKNAVETSKVFSPAVEKILSKIPGYEKLPKAVKTPIEYLADKVAEFGASKVGLEALVERLEPLSPLQLAATIDGYLGDYSTMDMAIGGQFTILQRADVLTLGRRTNYITQLSMHVASDDFPDYHLEVTRNDVALPWVHTSALGNDLVAVIANTFSDRGFKDGMITDSDRGALASSRLVGGYGAWRTIDAALNIVKNFFGRSLGGGGTPNCSGADAICYRMLDGQP